jgi:hypothetical protein
MRAHRFEAAKTSQRGPKSPRTEHTAAGTVPRIASVTWLRTRPIVTLNAQKENFRQGGGFKDLRSERRPVVCKTP